MKAIAKGALSKAPESGTLTVAVLSPSPLFKAPNEVVSKYPITILGSYTANQLTKIE